MNIPMNILLIRHGQTAGNIEKRYVGRTDEELTEETEKLLETASPCISGQPVSTVCMSPMRRCLKTAELLFPEKENPRIQRIVIPGLTECDFGNFEYKNYLELSGEPDYQRFLDSGGTWGFPGGEAIGDFKTRCASAFKDMVRELSLVLKPEETAAFVIHGGCIMAILDAYSHPHSDYFSWQAGCLEGFSARLVPDRDSPAGFHLANVAKIQII